jgi:hypothetical protein
VTSLSPVAVALVCGTAPGSVNSRFNRLNLLDPDNMVCAEDRPFAIIET